MAFTKVPVRVLNEFKELLMTANTAKQRCDDYIRGVGLALDVDMTNPKVGLDFEKGGFVTPDPEVPAVPVDEEPTYIEVK